MAEKNAATMTLDEVVAEVNEIRPVLRKAFEEAGGTLDMSKVIAFGEGLDDRGKSERMSAMNVRINELGARKDKLTEAEKGRATLDELGSWLDQPAGGAPNFLGRPGGKNYGGLVKASMPMLEEIAKKGLKRYEGTIEIDGKDFAEYELKTVMSTGAGYAPQSVRTGIEIGAAFQPPTVIDLLPVVPSDQAAYVFMEQTTRTNNAAEATESANGSLVSLAESAFAWTQRSETIQRIGHFVPVTDQQLKYIQGLADSMRGDMVSGVRERLSSQILNGDGSAPNISGFLDGTHRTTISDVDCTGEFIADAIDKLIEKVEITGFTNVDAGIMHNSDWHGYRRATTADGIYIAGNPSDNTPPRMWGIPLVLTTEITQGRALVGNFGRFARLVMGSNIEFALSSEHASYFIQGVQAMKAEVYATLAVLRATAFAKTDDIVVS